MTRIERITIFARAAEAYIKGAENCYCDSNQGCMPCQPCGRLLDAALKALEPCERYGDLVESPREAELKAIRADLDRIVNRIFNLETGP